MLRDKCDECGGKLIETRRAIALSGVPLGTFSVWICETCGQELHDAKTSQLIETAAKKKGLWGTERKKTLTVSH